MNGTMTEVQKTLKFRAEARARDAARKTAKTEKIQTRTMGRTDVTMARRRSCPICRKSIEMSERYRWVARVDVTWHVECESNTERYARLQAKIATMPNRPYPTYQYGMYKTQQQWEDWFAANADRRPW